MAARLLPLWPAPPGGVIAGVDLAFLPCLAVVVARPIVQVRQARNYGVPLVVGVLAVANLLVHLEHLGVAETARAGVYLGVDLVVLLIAVIGGRVVPFFTERALPGAAPLRARLVEPVCLATTALFAAVDPFGAPPLVLAVVSAAAAVSHAIRLVGWYDPRIWRVPLLWVLHVGYAWVIVGFVLKVGVAAGWVAPARHPPRVMRRRSASRLWPLPSQGWSHSILRCDSGTAIERSSTFGSCPSIA
jgi:uncharacterized protein involved in response to NO